MLDGCRIGRRDSSRVGAFMKVLLVGNYLYDGSTSMQIWARALQRELSEMAVEVRLIAPRPIFGRLRPSSNGLGKWLGYIDRFMIFPLRLRAAAADADLVHICDHGNAMYCASLGHKPTVVTCHDMLAVRGAMHEVPEMRASLFGRYLQSWICDGLRLATKVACVSSATYDDASRILGGRDRLLIVLNGLNYPFKRIPADEAERRLAGIPNLSRPFLLHVGSNHSRKNRAAVLRVFAALALQSDLQLVFAGEALDKKLLAVAGELGVLGRVVQVVKSDVDVLEALYNRAIALLFPSSHEGFGWPVIEAQACGCPVVASDIPPLVEVLRDTALLHRLDDEKGMAGSIRRLLDDEEYCSRVRQLGFENVRSRFQTARMMNEYVALYKEIAAQNQDHLVAPEEKRNNL